MDSSKNVTLHWRHNERDGVSNHQQLDCFFNRLFRRRSKKTSKLRVTDVCAGWTLTMFPFDDVIMVSSSSWQQELITQTYSQFKYDFFTEHHLVSITEFVYRNAITKFHCRFRWTFFCPVWLHHITRLLFTSYCCSEMDLPFSSAPGMVISA